MFYPHPAPRSAPHASADPAPPRACGWLRRGAIGLCLALLAPWPTHAASDLGPAFSTRYAHFEPMPWSQLAGWREDDLREAVSAFLRSCSALGSKPQWSALCEQARGLGPDADVRHFFEAEFNLYQIRDPDRTGHGVVTGYYEPLLQGSRTRGGPYVYPVYGLPEDLLFLDIRAVPPERRNGVVAVRVAGRTVTPDLAATPGEAGLLSVDLSTAPANPRDKKVRLRREGDRLIPYFTRAEIEQGALSAPVLAWTNDPVALYSMQIQGSGKIRLSDSQILRVAYREQNGHPFTPTVAAPSGRPKAARTRGLAAEIVLDDEDGGAAPPVLVRGLHLAPTASPPLPVPASTTVASTPSGAAGAEVEAWVEKLLAQQAPASGKKATVAPPRPDPAPPPIAVESIAPPAKPTPRPPAPTPTRPSVPAKVTSIAPAPAETGPPVTATWPAAISRDPSYVFFREIPDSPDGPIGALGVPLTAGRSIAVDPRTTPLGLPVFLATRSPDGRGTLSRLMIAQDTGGAISGAVRADYFWGFGDDARARASRMKENGQMWLLMPKTYPVASLTAARRTRSLGAAGEPECVVPDPDLCVEDRPTAP